jgi:iron(III) transport system ATP-binding protein
MAAVELQGLGKVYGAQTALEEVDLTIAHGELVCLLGPSGCGKTTTLRLIAGFIEPTSGTIRVGERVVSSPARTLPPEQRNMSMIFQSYALWPHMSVRENVAYGLRLRKLPRDEIARKVDAILSVARLLPLAERYPTELSGGQQQRVALARALVVEPETLLLDEPLSNLDANLREEMRFELRRLHDEYRYTTVYVTHDQAEALTTADRVVVMNAGRIEQVGSPEEIYAAPNTEFVARFIGGTNILRGRSIADDCIAMGDLRLRCGAGEVASSGETAVSIRFHDVQVMTTRPRESTENLAPGRIARHAFLGASRDYVVELAGGTQLRVTTPATQALALGSEVWVHLPAAHCRALTG